MAKKDSAQKAKHAANERKRRAAKSHDGPRKSGYKGKIREKKLIEASKSNKGCSPKVLTLVLPFLAVGAYLLFN